MIFVALGGLVCVTCEALDSPTGMIFGAMDGLAGAMCEALGGLGEMLFEALAGLECTSLLVHGGNQCYVHEFANRHTFLYMYGYKCMYAYLNIMHVRHTHASLNE